ncbi:MAG: phytoene desaturase family protein [Frankiaceae bacterium]
MADAVVIGAGPNGLVAANVLADAGWDVLVLEAADEPGGAVRSDEPFGPDFVVDTFSAFYPLASASPAFRSLGLERYGLRWKHAPAVLAHPTLDGRAAVLSRDLATTVASLDAYHPGDGEAWARLYGQWERVGDRLLEALLTPFPPVRPGLRLLRELRAAGALRLARFAMLPVRRVGEEEFGGEGAPLLLAGSALHSDLAPESALSAVFGWLLCMLGQQHGFPVPEGGAGQLTAALVRRLEARGGRVECGAEVTEVVIRDGRAVGVRTSEGEEAATHAVLADVVAPRLYGGLVAWEHLPAGMRDDMRRFQWDFATVKVDWALDGPVPWTAAGVAGAGTVHLADDLDALTTFCAQIAMQRVPEQPFLLVGQMTTADPARSPAGTESAWAYTHVPRTVRGDEGADGGVRITGRWDASDADAMADRIERQVERFAPGFRDRIRGRRVLTPLDLERRNANLVGGAINGGTSALHQQLVFRPVPGLGRPETPVPGLYLASSSAHPGGGVHGACGANAARSALRGRRTGMRMISAPVVRGVQQLARGPGR